MKTKTPPTRKRKTLNLIKNDPWLEPFSAAIEGRHDEALRRERELLGRTARHCQTLPTRISISVFTVRPTEAGHSANGHQTPLQ